MPATIIRHATPHPPIRLGTQHRRVIYASFALLWLSGALWLVFHYFLRHQGTFGPEPNALEPWWLRLHGLAMMIMLVAAGSVIVHHAQRAWQLGKNRTGGVLLTGCLLWLAATGYALYYFTTDGNQAWLPLLHWIPGLGMPAAILLHVVRGQRRGQRRVTAEARSSLHEQQPRQPRAL
jgi:hypothetical protein